VKGVTGCYVMSGLRGLGSAYVGGVNLKNMAGHLKAVVAVWLERWLRHSFISLLGG
jgi:hypothetical protein